jgi:formylglycine-generating enzyme required for sulfatase activity
MLVALSVALLGAVSSGVDARTVNIEWVTVGNPGNPGDPDASGFGAVNYAYRIGKYEVTNAQYATFLNAKATVGDPTGLYQTAAAPSNRGGIVRAGSGTPVDPYAYTVKPNFANKPVNYVGWYDAVRFANWLHNGQGDADTESGAYTILGGGPFPTNGVSIVRNPIAQVWLPSEHEWHKAALYDPTRPTDPYWSYATRSNATPTQALATATGDVANPGANVVNYFGGADWNGENGNVLTVGGAGPSSESFYGAADMNGNVFEWCEDLRPVVTQNMRARRGGSFVEQAEVMVNGGLGSASPGIEIFSFGFRVAAVIPEPGCGMVCASLMMLLPRRRGARGK